jgi:hypothetical protein
MVLRSRSTIRARLDAGSLGYAARANVLEVRLQFTIGFD